MACYNREDHHGRDGMLYNVRLQRDGDRVVIVEDVTTAGTSVRESIPLLKGAANVALVGLGREAVHERSAILSYGQRGGRAL